MLLLPERHRDLPIAGLKASEIRDIEAQHFCSSLDKNHSSGARHELQGLVDTVVDIRSTLAVVVAAGLDRPLVAVAGRYTGSTVREQDILSCRPGRDGRHGDHSGLRR